MFIYVCKALAAGRINRPDAERLLDDYRRCFVHYPYTRPAKYAIKQALEDGRHYHDRAIAANLIRELGTSLTTNDPGRE